MDTMKQTFNITLLLFIIFIDVLLCSKISKPVVSQQDAVSWLNKFGYNPCLNSDVQCSLSLSTLLQDYQKRFRLKITGKLDDKTKEHMNRPRCGNEDKPIAEMNAASLSGLNKWSRSSLTYSIRGYPTQLGQTQTTNIIHEAFQAWADHVPLTIESVCSTCQADFVIDFVREQHTDRYPFDGAGGTLAHAFFPVDGRVHFDKDEPWTESFSNRDINLYLVAVHEIGHALGLDHTYNDKSIMYPSYQLMPKSNILPQPDRDAIQSIYGKQGSFETTRTTRSTTTKSTTTKSTRKSSTSTKNSVTIAPGKSHTRCRLFLDAAFKHPDGTFHTFNAGLLWRYLPDANSWENQFTTEKIYPKLPDRLKAGVYDSRKNEIVFFTDKYVYRYDVDYENRVTLRKEQSLPRNLQNSIVGAIYYHSEIHIITSTTIRLFELDNSYQQSNERSLSEEFPRFTGRVKTAFSYGNLHHFFTNTGRVYVWSERLNSWQTFGEPMETGWFACSGTNTNNPTFVHTDQSVEKPNYRNPNRHRHRHHHHYD
ncbi:unnamed protein product [Rotaria sp. Silwood2]|nr:unnamed protein product [Rotaria sp. Silwood2]CAF2483184.1 unnamed protein product [Rotaria sp. Silwood2]CAF2715563.1 unnamed protein product [Rotaria sp. Silwood2]CAF3849615.1 unnamed protein product [Rotaria sp. Silwood2]CAF4005094.1 unnamed protein product [Rotaria sp. Silwood2]